jgi:LemA protein
MELAVILLLVVGGLILVGVLIYNGLVTKRNRVDEAVGQIEVQLKRRHDLVPNLVAAVRDVMGFEQDVLTRVTDARANAVAAGAQGQVTKEQVQAENQLSGALRSLFAVAENYPQIRANDNVLALQEQLTTTENQINFSRQHYNTTINEYNPTIQTIPSVLIAGPLGFIRREFFDAEPEADQVPVVALR